jgi:hypothetical protein
MAGAISAAGDAGDQKEDRAPAWPQHRGAVLLVGIMLVAAVLRLFDLGQSSLWYDEVVTMRLARTEGPAALFRLLGQIDATRAPLHPLLLQGWVALFGPFAYPARVFSVLCGILTTALVYWIGLRAYDATTGLWASWLCAVSPLLVYYSREVRMYALLVTLTCLSWGVVFAHGRAPRFWKLAVYVLSLVALAYCHPLGLFMIAALGLATLVCGRAFGISPRAWAIIHLAAVVAVLPWMSQYIGHEPETVSGPLPFRFLLGMPIGFIGGNFIALLVCSLLIAYGIFGVGERRNGRIRIDQHGSQPIQDDHAWGGGRDFRTGIANGTRGQPAWDDRESVLLLHGHIDRAASSISLLIWLVVPTLLLYLYSRVAYPVFGPARYTLFAGPAYLILVARGLAKLPGPLGIAAGAAGAALSGAMLLSDVYRPGLKADWRGVAAYLERHDPSSVIAVIAADPNRNVEVETARYYLEPHHAAIPWRGRPEDLMLGERPVWVSIGVRAGRAPATLPAALTDHVMIREVVDFPGLRLIKVEPIANHHRADERAHDPDGRDR